MKAIHIFRAGKHTAASGAALEFTEADLRASAAAYDPKIHEAPIVVGHPRDNGPAYGWISALNYAEDGLHADPAQIDADFSELVTSGKFKKVSASFYTPDSASNPVPGVYYLRHVGFLGAQPPALKGLKAVSFNEADEGVVEFADLGTWEVASFFRRFREWFIDKYSREEADAILPSYMVENMEQAARVPTDAPIANYQETDPMTLTPEQIAELQGKAARVDALEAEAAALREQSTSFAEREAQLAAQEATRRHEALVAKVDGLIAAGKVLPAKKDGLVAFLESLPAESVVEFGEGDGATKQPAQEYMLGFLGDMPSLVEFGELGAPDGNGKPDGLSAQEVAKQAANFREAQAAKGIQISTTEAVQAVMAGTAE